MQQANHDQIVLYLVSAGCKRLEKNEISSYSPLTSCCKTPSLATLVVSTIRQMGEVDLGWARRVAWVKVNFASSNTASAALSSTITLFFFLHNSHVCTMRDETWIKIDKS